MRAGQRQPGGAVQLGAFALALAGIVLGTLAFGADGAAASQAGGAGLAALGALAARSVPGRPPLLLGLGLIVFLFLREALSARLGLAGPELAALAGAGGAFAVGAAAGAETARARRAARLVTITLLGLTTTFFLLHVTNPDAVLGQTKLYHEGRLTGTFLSANTAATFCALGLLLGTLGTARAARGAQSLSRVGERIGQYGLSSLILALVALAALLATGSRAGIAIGLAASAGGAAWQMRGQRGSRALAVLGVATLVLFLGSGGVLGDRLVGLGAEDQGRLALWRASFAAFAERPLLGHGLGGFARAIAPHGTAETAVLLSAQGAAHSLLLQWLVQTGIVGTTLGAVVLVSVVRELAYGLGRRGRGRWLIRYALLSLVLCLGHGLVDYALEVPAVLWWLALSAGLGCGVAGGETRLRDRRSGRARG